MALDILEPLCINIGEQQTNLFYLPRKGKRELIRLCFLLLFLIYSLSLSYLFLPNSPQLIKVAVIS